jgi:hypothetical protein
MTSEPLSPTERKTGLVVRGQGGSTLALSLTDVEHKNRGQGDTRYAHLLATIELPAKQGNKGAPRPRRLIVHSRDGGEVYYSYLDGRHEKARPVTERFVRRVVKRLGPFQIDPTLPEEARETLAQLPAKWDVPHLQRLIGMVRDSAARTLDKGTVSSPEGQDTLQYIAFGLDKIDDFSSSVGAVHHRDWWFRGLSTASGHGLELAEILDKVAKGGGRYRIRFNLTGLELRGPGGALAADTSLPRPIRNNGMRNGAAKQAWRERGFDNPSATVYELALVRNPQIFPHVEFYEKRSSGGYHKLSANELRKRGITPLPPERSRLLPVEPSKPDRD